MMQIEKNRIPGVLHRREQHLAFSEREILPSHSPLSRNLPLFYIVMSKHWDGFLSLFEPRKVLFLSRSHRYFHPCGI